MENEVSDSNSFLFLVAIKTCETSGRLKNLPDQAFFYTQ